MAQTVVSVYRRSRLTSLLALVLVLAFPCLVASGAGGLCVVMAIDERSGLPGIAINAESFKILMTRADGNADLQDLRRDAISPRLIFDTL